MTINAAVLFTINEGTQEQFESAFAEGRKAFLEDEGCLRYDLQKVRGSELDYILLEAYETEGAIEIHNANPALRTMGRALKGSIASGPDIRILEPAGEQVALVTQA